MIKQTLLATAIGLSLILGGCDEKTLPPLIITKYRVVDIPPELYRSCPELSKLPKYQKLTDREVARLVIRLYNGHKACRDAILAIKSFIEAAQKISG